MCIATKHCGGVLQEYSRQLPKGSLAVHCRNFGAHCPQAVWQSITGVPRPTSPKKCCGALQEYPLPIDSVAMHCKNALPTAYKHCGSALQEFPQAVWQSITGVPRPTSPKNFGGALQESPYPLPIDSVALHCKSSLAHCPQAVWQ